MLPEVMPRVPAPGCDTQKEDISVGHQHGAIGQIEVIDALRSRGVEVLMSTGCDRTTVGVLVPVADDATVAWVTSHYPAVKVAGWLRPLPSGP